MRAMTALMSLLGYAALASSVLPPSAHADTMTFATGVESNGGVDANGTGKTCFGFSTTGGSAGLFRDPDVNSCQRHYFAPIYWRNFYSASTSRTVTLRARRASTAASIECSVFVFDAQGGVVSSSPVQTFPVTGANYGTMNMTVTNVLASGSTLLSCNQTPGNTWLLSYSWTP
jgi:hypothetical protein